jgi:putative tricarboxylic transport membrane protein
MMMFFKKNLVFYFLGFAFSIGYFVTAVNLGNPVSNNRLEPSFFPLVLGFFAVLFSSILLLREIASSKKQESSTQEKTVESDQSEAKKSKYSPLLIMLSIFVYIFAFSFIGYFISSFLFVLSIIVIFSSLEKIIQKSIISIIIVLIGYLVFDQLFGVRLPALWG